MVPPATFGPIPVVAHGLGDVADLGIGLAPLLWLCGAAVVAGAWWSDRHPAAAGSVAPGWAADLGRAGRAVAAGVGLVAAAAVVLPAAFGPADAAANPAPRLLFSVGWAAVLVASALLGPVWRHASPLRLVSGAVARVVGDPDEQLTRDLPDRVGVWPAVASALAFVAAQQLTALSGLALLVAVLVYALVHVVAAAVFGRSWYARAEVFEVASELFGALAPVGRNAQGRLCWRSPRRGLASLGHTPGLPALLAVLAGGALYDAATYDTTVAAPALTLALCIALAYAGILLAGHRRSFVPALVAAVAGHTAVQLFGVLLVDLQATAVLASDPFGRGWNLLGLTGQEIVAEPIAPALGVATQLVLLLWGHVLAIVTAAVVAGRVADGARAAALQVPLRAVVFGSALAGVWLRLQ